MWVEFTAPMTLSPVINAIFTFNNREHCRFSTAHSDVPHIRHVPNSFITFKGTHNRAMQFHRLTMYVRRVFTEVCKLNGGSCHVPFGTIFCVLQRVAILSRQWLSAFTEISKGDRSQLCLFVCLFFLIGTHAWAKKKTDGAVLVSNSPDKELCTISVPQWLLQATRTIKFFRGNNFSN